MEVPVLLHLLLQNYDPAIDLSGVPNLEILGLSDDSRLVRRGDLFIARPGTKTDGRKFIEDAKSRGAVAVITPANIQDPPLPQIVLPDPAAASRLANAYHNHPSRKLKLIGITGTNGKTTVAYLVRHILTKSNLRCGMIGTVEFNDGLQTVEASMTTPGPIELAQWLARMRDQLCKACAMEVSSHALDQNRVAGVQFAAAAFTNLTGDHLDYHQTMPRYAAAKAKLFEMLDPSAVAVVNTDDDHWRAMVHRSRARVLRYGFADSADYRARDVLTSSAGTNFVLLTPNGTADVRMQLIGRHNIQNALCAAALAIETMGLSVQQVAAALTDATGAPGRLQTLRCGQNFAVLVDYAHTDDALANVLSALRPLVRGKLRVLFGCGGDRDRTKRPRMAAVAEKLADCVYVTSDNPRTEDPSKIIADIAQGFSPARPKCVMIDLDRRKTIRQIVADARDGDVVLLAGKGHENYQILGTQKHHFDDMEEARAALAHFAPIPSPDTAEEG
jgi:UDP-N-acetylmuramoyl-L-alanyl-D-glutamate--2,6-diaminopimelate ligase